MPAPIREDDLDSIESVVARHEAGIGLGGIAKELLPEVSRRTLQYRLRALVENGRLVAAGQGKGTRYSLPKLAKDTLEAPAKPRERNDAAIPLSLAGEEIQRYVSQPLSGRKPVGYQRNYLDSYRPNETFYLTQAERAQLAQVGKPDFANQAAGTYAKQILNRLLIDLSWNSSRLEGNTYSLLDTQRLIEFGQEHAGSHRLDAQMIVNHKEAIEFLVNDADEIGFNRYTIQNLHAMLAQNLLPDPAAPGRLRQMGVGISGSTFHPLAVPQLIAECFDEILSKAAAIADPFEQALFAMVQLPYLQPFDDVNKRVSRLAANIPFIQRNLSPLSFTDVPTDLYTQAILGVYELNRMDLLKDVFVWAYKRSADSYAAVRQSLGEPDPFRYKYSGLLRTVVGDVIRGMMNKAAAAPYIQTWASENVPAEDQEQFRASAETELLSLHDGNFARYQIRPSEFAAWQKIWS